MLFNRQKQKVIDLIIISKVYSVSRLVSLSGVRQDKVIRMINECISEANATGFAGIGSNRAWRALRGATLDFDRLEIIPAEVIEPTALEGTLNMFKNVVQSKFAKNLPKEPEKPWTCPYCNSKNPAEIFDCNGCSAKRQA